MADARLTAVRHLLGVLEGRSLDSLLLASDGGGDERDRALASDICYGVCRWFRRLDALVGRLLQRPLKPRDRDLHVLLLVGAYQLLYTRVPPHAALSATVETTRALGKAWASGLVNGVLRRLQRERVRHEAAVDATPACRYALPDWIYIAIRDAWPTRADAICAQMQERPPMTLRVDLSRISRAKYADRLGQAGMLSRPHPGVASALVLEQPVAVAKLPGFAAGLVSIQDAGAQLAAPLLDLAPGQRVLDACAAPGGKTLHLLQHQQGLRLTALDIDPQRLRRVAENCARGGVTAELVFADAARPDDKGWAQTPYDRILLDAPCSATGVLRRHPDIRLLRRASDIPALAARQAKLLDALWPLLSPGGRLLYVTCSLLPAENADTVAAFLRRRPDAAVVSIPGMPGTRSGDGVQLLPDIDQTDGFFYAALCKADQPQP